MALKTQTPRITRAYIEGLIAGQFGEGHIRSPHSRKQEDNDWKRGYRRGRTLRALYQETEADDEEMQEDVKSIRRSIGESA